MTTQSKFPEATIVTVTRNELDGTNKVGCGAGKHLYVGRRKTGGVARIYRSYIKFNIDWSDVGQIKSFVISLFSDDGLGLFPPPGTDDKPKIKVRRISPTSTIKAGNNADGVFDASDWTAPDNLPASEVVKVMAKAANGLTRIDLTNYANHWAPSTVRQSNGNAGGKDKNNGIVLLPFSTDTEINAWSGWSDHATTPGFVPIAELVYEPGLTNPDVPTNLSPSGSIGVLQNFEGDFSDIRSGATLQRANVEIYAAGATASGQTVTGTLEKEYMHVASASEVQAARASVPPDNFPAALDVNHKWRMRHQNDQGRWGLWTGLTTFSIDNTVPTAPTLTPTGKSYGNLSGVVFRGRDYSDADNDPLLAYRIQLSSLAEGDPAWDTVPEAIRWDTGKVLVASGATGFDRLYGGDSLATGDYTWRAMWWDAREGQSDWSYATITLTSDFDQDPGSIDIPIFNPQAPWRIVIYDMAEDRGPGNVVAVITQPKSVGASVMYNAPGEMHFTIPVTHPQASVIEPKQTHYAVQFFGGDGWRDIYNGLVWDYDATDTDVIFYGLDYLALFDQLVDDRFDASAPDKGYIDGGSKYNNVTISGIINDQLTRAIGLTDSPVGFITVGTIDSMGEQVTIWSTFTTCLQFCVGLIDSHKQGSGKRTRIYVYRDGSTWKVGVNDDAGTTRDNLRLRYGELVQGYRVVPFGQGWSSRSNVIGRNLNSAQVFYKSSTAPGIDPAVWGRFDGVQILNNIDDDNDLRRRAKQQAVAASKLGRQVGLGIRSGLLLPRNGYDVCDALPVAIQHGVVDTDRFGSGYWIVYGIAWEGGDDGSSTVILTLQPREDSVAPDPDLIPSSPISTQAEWQVGWVPPDPLIVSSKYWVDQSTGKVYKRDESGASPVYNVVTDSNILPAAPSAPTGLALSSATSVDTNGLPQANLTVTIDPITEAHVRAVYVEVEW